MAQSKILIIPFFGFPSTFCLIINLHLLCGALILHSPNNFLIAPLVEGLNILSAIL
jgi:hypothetical protein